MCEKMYEGYTVNHMGKIHILLFFSVSYNNLWLNSDPQSVWCFAKHLPLSRSVEKVYFQELYVNLFIYLDKLMFTQLFPNLQEYFSVVITKLITCSLPSGLSICSDCIANSAGSEQQIFLVEWDDVKLLTYLRWKLCQQPKWCWLLKAAILLILLCGKQYGIWGQKKKTNRVNVFISLWQSKLYPFNVNIKKLIANRCIDKEETVYHMRMLLCVYAWVFLLVEKCFFHNFWNLRSCMPFLRCRLHSSFLLPLLLHTNCTLLKVSFSMLSNLPHNLFSKHFYFAFFLTALFHSLQMAHLTLHPVKRQHAQQMNIPCLTTVSNAFILFFHLFLLNPALENEMSPILQR